MDFNDFMQKEKNCYAATEGFALWKITDDEINMPYQLEGGNVDLFIHIIVLEGEMKVRHNDRVYPIAKGNFGNFIEQSSLTLVQISKDIRAYLVICTGTYMETIMKGNPPIPFSFVEKVRKHPVFMLSSKAFRLFVRRIECMEDIFKYNAHSFWHEMLKSTLWIFLLDIANAHIKEEEKGNNQMGNGHTKGLFIQFTKLLPLHIREEHRVSFYASKLCITPQYLNRIVKNYSKKAAHDWIYSTLLGEITKRLEDTDDSILQIADEFHFPDQATLAKFFKKQTGVSPTEYRKKHLL